MAAALKSEEQEGKEVLVVQTGGTIDKDYPSTLHGYAFEFGAPASERVLSALDLAFTPIYRTICREDSTDLTDEHREALAKLCVEARQTRILITHGTSTMVQTGRFLASRMGPCTEESVKSHMGKVIVITGALKPEKFRDSDAVFNLGVALGALAAPNVAPGIYVAMSGRVYPHDAVARDSAGRFVPLDTPGAVAGDDPGITL